MRASITHQGQQYSVDLSSPIDISMPLATGEGHASAWYVKPIIIEPVRMGNWVGDVNQGASVNFRNISFNPHGHGTHTECVGHISKEQYSINQSLKEFHLIAQLISVSPQSISNGDLVITAEQILSELNNEIPKALVIRTLPNDDSKLKHQYSNANPPYIHHNAIKVIIDKGVEHLLIDLPSVDREMDEGQLLAHKMFWSYPENPQLQRTITEMVFVPNQVADGMYLLNLQTAPFENDATPSRPVLYKLNKIIIQ